MAEQCHVREAVRILHDAAVVLGTHGVQLEEFACIVFVGMGRLAGIEVEHVHHRGGFADCLQHAAEVAERVRANGKAVEYRKHRSAVVIPAKHTEMVVPEIDHDFLQLARAVGLPDDRGAFGFRNRQHAPRSRVL